MAIENMYVSPEQLAVLWRQYDEARRHQGPRIYSGGHSWDCAYHLDQYSWECTCGGPLWFWGV